MRDEKLRRYEGLVFSTARMYEAILRIEREDLQQVLRLRVWIALEAYDSARSAASEESFVFTCVRNQMKDLVKARQRRDTVATEVYLEDVAPADAVAEYGGMRDRFEHEYLSTIPPEEDEVTLPSTLSRDERQVIALLYVGYRQGEIAGLLAVQPREIWSHMRSIRRKMEDWRPPAGDGPGGQVVHLPTEAVQALRAA